MKLTDHQTTLLGLIERRNDAIVRRDKAQHDFGSTSLTYHSVVGEITGLSAAIEAFRGIEPVGSLEYLAVKPEAAKSEIPLEQWQV